MTPLLLLMLACHSDADDSGAGPIRDPRPIESRFEPPDTVVVIVVDTLARRYMSPWHPEWEITPNLEAFFADSTVLADTQAVRGLTSVSVSSIASGVYPRFHGVRDNRDWQSPWNPILSEMFQAKGYTTLGYAANTCQFIDRGIDERVCTWSEEPGANYAGQLARDAALVQQLSQSLRDHPADEKLFIWLHLIDPHDPFEAVPAWYAEFHPEPYEGELEPGNEAQLDQWILEGRELTAEDKRHLDAVYASQVKETDHQLSQVFSALQEVGRWDDSVVMLTADHGEELAEHQSYFYHGCSVYAQTLQVMSAIRAPGRLPAGDWHDTPVSSVDLAPTLSQLSGIGWEGYRDGEDLVAELEAGALSPRPVYFERGLPTAGVVYDGHRYVLSIEEGTVECKPYELGGMFLNEYEELYDTTADPSELNNIADQDPNTLAALRDLTCSWITGDVWYSTSADLTHPMVDTCKDVLGIVDPVVDEGGGCGLGLGSSVLLAGLAGLLVGNRRRPLDPTS